MSHSSRITVLKTGFKELAQQLTDLLPKNILVLNGNCSAIFDGRIKSTLDWGDRILLVKSDESIILHGPTHVKPLNWQKEKEGRILFQNDSNYLKMTTFRPKTNERFEILFKEVYLAYSFEAEDLSQLEVTGDEIQFRKFLANNLSVIEEGLELLAEEKQSLHGFFDLYCKDKNGNHVIIEIKKQCATLADAQQLLRYRNTFSKGSSNNIRAILVAPLFSLRVKKYMIKRRLEIKKIAWQEIFPTILLDKQHPSLDSFLKCDQNE